jgi:hypothetical protein
MPFLRKKPPIEPNRTGESRQATALVERYQRLAEWMEAHPVKAHLLAVLLVLIVVGWEANYWPSHDFPGALWHRSPRGDDIELAQANAANAGWKELWGYWFGPMIHGHGYYRPLTSWLFVGEYRLFGTADGKWAFVNIALHLAVCVLLTWSGGVLAGGRFARRLTIGTAAALLVGAPGFADRTIQIWICGWWPCQSELLSLLAGLTLLAATVRFVETGRGRWLAFGVIAMVVGILFKEMTYVAALGACLLLLRRRDRWWGGLGMVVPALVLFVFRKWAIRHVQMEGGIPVDALAGHVSFQAAQAYDQLSSAWQHFAALAVGVVIAWAVLRRSGRLERAIVAVVLYLSIICLRIGMPWEAVAWTGMRVLAWTVFGVAVGVGLLRAARRWPAPELCLVWLLTQLPAQGFMPIFGWYRYWGSVFGALLVAIALWELMEWGTARFSPCPTRSTPQTPESRRPEAGESLATAPSTA